MIRWLTFAIFLTTAAAAAYLGGQRGAVAIERMLSERIAHGLAVLQIDWITLDVDGVRVEMRGRAPSVEGQALAAETARATTPWAYVLDRTAATISPPPPRDPLLVELHLDEQGLTATGRFDGAEMQTGFAQLIAATAPDLAFHDLTGTNAAPPNPGFGRELASVALAVTDLSEAFIKIQPGRVEIEGVAPDEATRMRLQAALLEEAGSAIALHLDLGVPPQVIIPYRFVAWKDYGGTRIETCAARNAKEQAAFLAAFRRHGVTDHAGSCPVGLGAPVGDWEAAVLAGLAALDQAPVGRFDLTYLTASLELSSPVDEDGFAVITGDLTAALPDGFRLRSKLDQTPSGPAIPRDAYWMRIERTADGVALSGRVQGEAERETLIALAAAHTARNTVQDGLTPNPFQPPPDWQNAAHVVLSLLRDVDGLSASLSAGRLALSGTVDGPDQAGALHRLLGERLPIFEISTDLTIDLPQIIARQPLAAGPCVEVLNRTIRAAPIAFETGSAVIDPSSDATLDELGDVLRRCGTLSVEIGGHTDSQGSEEFNLRLSQLRAESVLTALLDRRLPLDRLSAAGYGESTPTASNSTPEGRAANRRIEFRRIED